MTEGGKGGCQEPDPPRKMGSPPRAPMPPLSGGRGVGLPLVKSTSKVLRVTEVTLLDASATGHPVQEANPPVCEAILQAAIQEVQRRYGAG